ncbi:NAD(P)/FAD-dependent oxidoreductase [Actinomycetospora sp. TBRC 11914]|uniref:NAD(P)/FAD-dependent oxidoreductase n=1 Tax=Actinomycetospora sp. TBRC 11914 TaxID=2729387 RepID=UPI00145C7D52|nr:NAD(P)/FAD-dependent oxidoreductase [Actinomycetospora sp. TBRC 11914]NMO92598.1 NAD(P)/FAD-dependent oxidoreductase [Actinomycetospora sp. TBRC 11914]
MAAERIVVVGAGFAGLECVKRLEKRLRHEIDRGDVEVVVVSPHDYMLYLPLLPQVAAGVITTQAVTVSLPRALKRAHRLPGTVVGVDLERSTCIVHKISGEEIELPYDRLVLAPGSVTRKFDIPGLDEHALGMKNLAEAAYLRDHVISQLELANASTDDEERAARLQFVVVGGGYAGTETAACLQLLTESALKRFPRLDPGLVRWTLVDIAPRLMPELGERLGEQALDLLRRRGIEIKLETGVQEVTDSAVTFTDGTTLPTRTLVWTAGVTSNPLVKNLDVELVRGRLKVGADFLLPGRSDVFSLGDCAAVPDLTQDDPDAICPPTAQHATRMAATCADNVVASLHGQALKQYKHHDLGLVVDLGGTQAVAHPLGLELTGATAQVVTRGYHVFALPLMRTRLRVIANWILHLFGGDEFIRIGFLSGRKGTVEDFEGADTYLSADQIRERARAS